ncbi:MAG TPA: hypothetical protein VFG42_08220 [Baekduia sp.]|uniref:hypothetical protein n=1 Tax=Baekduia sp. TaxID=2600305 RepID=UPI002D793079|nr:hypothetical protein [Baekduia sp.]HET6506760.1 hypothetical protein [Baekduia sp.]
MSNLSPTSLPITATTTTSGSRARKRRAKRGIVANYIHEISPRHRAAEAVTPTVAPTREPAPVPERAG